MSNRGSNPPDGASELTRDALGPEQRAILELQARFCRTMGHPIRLFILHHLHETGGEVGSSELAEMAGISRASISQHLSKMTAVGLVATRRSGKYVFVRLGREDVGKACELVHQALEGETRDRAELLGDS